MQTDLTDGSKILTPEQDRRVIQVTERLRMLILGLQWYSQGIQFLNFYWINLEMTFLMPMRLDCFGDASQLEILNSPEIYGGNQCEEAKSWRIELLFLAMTNDPGTEKYGLVIGSAKNTRSSRNKIFPSSWSYDFSKNGWMTSLAWTRFFQNSNVQMRR